MAANNRCERATATQSSCSTARSTITPRFARSSKASAYVSNRAATPKWCSRPFSSGTRVVSAPAGNVRIRALWTGIERRLVLVRDRLGIKPLYIHQRGDDLYFGSELKTLFVHPEIERQIDLDGLNLLSLAELYSRHRTRWSRGSEKLPPGHWLEWQDGRSPRTRTGGWSSIRSPRAGVAANEELDAPAACLVKEHLISDVPLGVWSSGGLDSSTILHYAAEAPSQAEDVLGFVPRTQFRREPLVPRDRREVRDRSSRVRSEPRSRTCRRDRGDVATIPTSPAPMPARCRSGFFRRCAGSM